MALVAVATPVYNGEKYLAECIESVRAQTFTDWEYVIVNNCSTDGSLAIAEEFARRDKRIRVHSNDRLLPVIANFNRAAAAALAPAGARYLKFVCADDTLFPECLQKMTDVAEANPGAQIVTSYKIHGRTAVCEGPPYPAVVTSGRDVCRWFFEGKLGILGSPTDFLVRVPADGWPGGIFDETYLHADIEFAVRVLKDGADHAFVHQVLMFTRTHDEAVSASARVMGTDLPEYVAMVDRYGPSFLSPADHRRLLREYRSVYAGFLFRALLKRDAKAWGYHAAKRRTFGVDVGVMDMIGAGLRGVADAGASPIRTFRRARGAYRRVKDVKPLAERSRS